MEEVERRTAFANIPAALGLITALSNGAADDARAHLHQLVEEGRAEGVIKALCLLNLNTSEDRTPSEIQAAVQVAALQWAQYEDLAEGEVLVDDEELTALVHEPCTCGHSAARHDGHTHWALWDLGEQTRSGCDDCDCIGFN